MALLGALAFGPPAGNRRPNHRPPTVGYYMRAVQRMRPLGSQSYRRSWAASFGPPQRAPIQPFRNRLWDPNDTVPASTWLLPDPLRHALLSAHNLPNKLR